MGKTTLARSLSQGWPPDRVFVHDPKIQFPDYAELGPGTIVKEGREEKPHHWVLQEPGSLIIIDEAHRVAQPGNYVKGWEWLKLVANEGRHFGLTAIFCARRPSIVHYDLRALVEACYVGRTTASRDLKALCQDVDEECIRCKDLEVGEFLVFYP
jgi:hypothetical protein